MPGLVECREKELSGQGGRTTGLGQREIFAHLEDFRVSGSQEVQEVCAAELGNREEAG